MEMFPCLPFECNFSLVQRIALVRAGKQAQGRPVHRDPRWVPSFIILPRLFGQAEANKETVWPSGGHNHLLFLSLYLS